MNDNRTTDIWDDVMASLGLEPSSGPRRNRAVAACGTESGAQRHYRRGEPLCTPCREARREAQNERNRARREGRAKPRKVINCGTHEGADRHRSRGETVCEPCRTAYNRWQSEYRAALKVAA